MLPEGLVRYREVFDKAFYAFCKHYPGPIAEMLDIHLGWRDSHSRILDLITTRGKEIRPSLCLLTTEAVGGDWKAAIHAAVALEALHNASLIHDDIQDNDSARHHFPTVWKLHGVAQAINVGDWALTLNVLSVLDLEKYYPPDLVLSIQRLIAETTLQLIHGQSMDISFEGRWNVSEKEYFEMIGYKTGALIESSVAIGAKLGGASKEQELHLRRYAQYLGSLFQLADDISQEDIRSDIQKRKWTYPILLAFQQSSVEEKKFLKRLWKNNSDMTEAEVESVKTVFDRLGIIEQTTDLISHQCTRAVSAVHDASISDLFVQDFVALAEFLLKIVRGN